MSSFLLRLGLRCLVAAFAGTAFAGGSSTVLIDSGPSGYTNDNTASFAFTMNVIAPPATPQCRVYPSASMPPAFGACSSATAHTTAALGEGAFTFEVIAVDSNGPGPVSSRNFAVDTLPPTLQITNSYYDETNNSTPTFTFNAGAGGGSPITVSCRVITNPPGPSPVPFALCTDAGSHTPNMLADGAYRFEVRVVDAAGNDGPNGEYRTFAIDTVAPKVTSVNSISVDDWSPVGESSIDVGVTKILVTFDDDMWQSAGPGQVTSFDNWRPLLAGPNGVIDTVDCGGTAGDDVAIPLQVTVIAFMSRTAGIGFGDSRGLQAGRYRLIACPGMLDSAGNPLDGASDGGGAEPHLIDFSVVTNPRIVNPNFDTTTNSGWIKSGPVPSAWSNTSWDGTGDAEGQRYSGAARLNTSQGAGAVWRLEQCVPYEPGVFGVSALTRSVSATGGAPAVKFTVHASSALDCLSGLTPIGESNTVVGDSAHAWKDLGLAPISAPDGAVALWLSFEITGGAATSYTVDIDRARYPEVLQLFFNGFEDAVR